MKKPNTCEGCPLFNKGKGFVPDQLANGKEEYVMFGEAPGSTEVAQGLPFVGKAGFVLKNWLMKSVPQIQIASEKGRVSYCNILHCLPPEVQGRPYPKGTEREAAEAHCKQYMHLSPEANTVILFGEVPQRYFFGEELSNEDATDKQLGHDLKGVLGRVGRVYMKGTKRFVFAPHPAYVLRQPALVGHGQQALRIATGEDKVAEVDYQSWDKAMGELDG